VIGLGGPDSGGAVVLPLLATQILWINLITDSAPRSPWASIPDRGCHGAQAAPAAGTGHRRPDVGRSAGDRCGDGAGHAADARHVPAGGLIEGTHELANARTAAFTTLVFAQLFNCFNARSESVSAFRHLFVNPWLWGAIALSVVLQVAVVHVGFLNLAFGTVPLRQGNGWSAWRWPSVVLWFDELRKLVARVFGR